MIYRDRLQIGLYVAKHSPVFVGIDYVVIYGVKGRG